MGRAVSVDDPALCQDCVFQSSSAAQTTIAKKSEIEKEGTEFLKQLLLYPLMLLSLSIAVVGILFIDKEYEHWRKDEWIHATLIYVAVAAGLMFLLWLGSSFGSSGDPDLWRS